MLIESFRLRFRPQLSPLEMTGVIVSLLCHHFANPFEHHVAEVHTELPFRPVGNRSFLGWPVVEEMV
jgi:hypothetical protein